MVCLLLSAYCGLMLHFRWPRLFVTHFDFIVAVYMANVQCAMYDTPILYSLFRLSCFHFLMEHSQLIHKVEAALPIRVNILLHFRAIIYIQQCVQMYAILIVVAYHLQGWFFFKLENGIENPLHLIRVAKCIEVEKNYYYYRMNRKNKSIMKFENRKCNNI